MVFFTWKKKTRKLISGKDHKIDLRKVNLQELWSKLHFFALDFTLSGLTMQAAHGFS